MIDLATIRQALADTVQAAVPSLHCSAYLLPSPDPPALCVSPRGPIGATAHFGGGGDQEFDCWVMVVLEDLVRAQRSLDTYVQQVVAVLEENPTLGLSDCYATVLGVLEQPSISATSPRLFAVPVRVRVRT